MPWVVYMVLEIIIDNGSSNDLELNGSNLYYLY